MTKIIHFSDTHNYGLKGKPYTSTLESIVQFSNGRNADHLVFTGDLLDGQKYGNSLSEEEKIAVENIPILLAAIQSGKPSEFMKKNFNAELSDDQIKETIQGIAPIYKNIAETVMKESQNAYKSFNEILSKSNATVEAIVGNHDVKGMEQIVNSANFSPNETFGRYFFQTGGPGGIPGELLYQNSPEEYAKHAVEKSPKVMLWHQGPYKTKWFNDIPDWTKHVNSKVHLYGHEHVGYHVKYDEKTKRLDVNVTTKDGYFAEIDMNDAGEAQKVKIYKLESPTQKEDSTAKNNNYKNAA